MKAKVIVCRGCCCGTTSKHPEVDHDDQLRRFESVARVKVVGCVDECSRSNVVIVRPGDGTSIWLGGVLGTDATEAVSEWLVAGCPRPAPTAVAERVFERRTSMAGEVHWVGHA